jgi:hypothetical protein
MVKMRWENTLTVVNNPDNNGGYAFVSYKWFRNDAQIGDKQSYSNDPVGGGKLPDGVYRVEATTADGITIYSCTETIALARSMEVKAYPNPVSSGQVLYIDADVEEALLEGAMINVYNIAGNRVAQVRVTGRRTEIPVNYVTGAYVLVLTGKDGWRSDLKVVVQ